MNLKQIEHLAQSIVIHWLMDEENEAGTGSGLMGMSDMDEDEINEHAKSLMKFLEEYFED